MVDRNKGYERERENGMWAKRQDVALLQARRKVNSVKESAEGEGHPRVRVDPCAQVCVQDRAGSSEAGGSWACPLQRDEIDSWGRARSHRALQTKLRHLCAQHRGKTWESLKQGVAGCDLQPLCGCGRTWGVGRWHGRSQEVG